MWRCSSWPQHCKELPTSTSFAPGVVVKSSLGEKGINFVVFWQTGWSHVYWLGSSFYVRFAYSEQRRKNRLLPAPCQEIGLRMKVVQILQQCQGWGNYAGSKRPDIAAASSIKHVWETISKHDEEVHNLIRSAWINSSQDETLPSFEECVNVC
jgi:hypothetical protein